jgi:hypothetical protein
MAKDRKKTPPAIVPQEDIGQADIPEFLQQYAGLGTENIGPEDCSPLYISETELDGIIREKGFDPFDALDMLLMSIITAYSDDRVSERLAEAKSALINEKCPTGRPSVDDYDILMDIAWEYHSRQVRNQKINRSEIIRECYRRRHPDAPSLDRFPESENSEVKRIRNKFEKEEKLLLARVTSEMNEDRMYAVRAVTQIAQTLSKLGVKVNLESIRPRLRRRNPR